eukprot:CAMPEP_0178618716 /NCGR_PEP_ID=MMETSP0698-20121128/4386_1 /TAXON_ID=265572 /ORGANISM="Extubocellulus spinifer, Strain CCMP396" /LENGTH=64 /DNA_ID=CAMNT_0020257617 /DNA_START=425 /DNA_END=616 /DNA_ORIENTATION=-
MELGEHIRTSAAVIRSTPAPMQKPWIAATTGMGHLSNDVMAACISMIWGRKLRTLRAVSTLAPP